MAFKARVESLRVPVDGAGVYPAMVLSAIEDPVDLVLQIMMKDGWHSISLPVETIKAVLGVES